MKKKFLLLFLSVVLMLSLSLAACANECDKNGHQWGDDGVCTVCGEVNPDYNAGQANFEWDAYRGSTGSGSNNKVLPDIPEGKASSPSIMLHYHRNDSNDYTTWGFWIWAVGSEGILYDMQYQDDFGGISVVSLDDVGATADGKIGIIPRLLSDWVKDGEADRIWDLSANTVDDNNYYHIYLTQGDIALYESEDVIQYGMTANFKSDKQIAITTKTPVTHVKVYEGDDLLAESDTDATTSIRYNLLDRTPNLEKEYKVEVTFVANNKEVSCNVGITALFDTALFNSTYTYNGELGALYTQNQTEFKVWSPVSTKIVLKLYNEGNGNAAAYQTVEMTKGNQGVFSTVVTGDLAGKYYTYTVYNSSYPTGMEIVDPYAKSAGLNGQRGQIVNFDETNPDGWDAVSPIQYDHNELVVWETHVADVTSSATWTGTESLRKTFLGMIESGTTYTEGGVTVATGFDHIKELGVNAVQLVPIFDQSNDEVNVKFNWGYNPLNYNVLEGAYSTNAADGYVRITEFKQLVQAFNQAGINIIMDVVYNHVSAAIGSNFDVLMPGYYYRYTSTGDMSNGSGCGNETASDRPMFRKFMIDSVSFWASEYKLGGFRFDLMGLHDIETMNELAAALKQINPAIAVYGEPWTGGTTTLAAGKQAVQKNANNLVGVAQFNDQMRDALIKGGLSGASEVGWVTGGRTSDLSKIVSGMQGITKSSSYTISDMYKTINYVTCHDNYTLYDRILATGKYNAEQDIEKIKQMVVLANAVVFTSNGTSFMLAGEELVRTKGGDHNSYESSYEVNELDYSRKIAYSDVFESYKALIAFKRGFVSTLGLTSNAIVESNYIVASLDGGKVITVTITAANATYVVVHCNAETSETINLEGYTLQYASIDVELSAETPIAAYQTIIACK